MRGVRADADAGALARKAVVLLLAPFPRIMCVGRSWCLQVVAGFVMWKASRVTRSEAAMVSQRQTLRAGVAKVRYTPKAKAKTKH